MYTYNKETINELVKDLNEVERYRVINFIKDLILSIIKGLINLFTGVIASIGKIVIGGINSIIQAIKIT